MKIERVNVEVLETPVALEYSAAGNAVSHNYHVLARVTTADGVQGIGYAVATRGNMVKTVAHGVEELGQHLVGMNVLETEAARARLSRAGGWIGPGGMLNVALCCLDIAMWDAAGKILGSLSTACWADITTASAPTPATAFGTACRWTNWRNRHRSMYPKGTTW